MNNNRLAPMCGVTDFIFRTICGEFGCETGYTEMISAMGYLCAPNQQATRELMIRGEGETLLSEIKAQRASISRFLTKNAS